MSVRGDTRIVNAYCTNYEIEVGLTEEQLRRMVMV